MKLHEAIAKILELNDSYNVIFAKKPWSFNAQSKIGKFEKNYQIPEDLILEGYEYFLEYSLIQELNQVKSEITISEDKFVDFVIYYAENDAYMDL